MVLGILVAIFSQIKSKIYSEQRAGKIIHNAKQNHNAIYVVPSHPKDGDDHFMSFGNQKIPKKYVKFNHPRVSRNCKLSRGMWEIPKKKKSKKITMS